MYEMKYASKFIGMGLKYLLRSFMRLNTDDHI